MADHPLCRPPKGAHRVMRLADVPGRGQRWMRDNGEPGLAFVGLLEPEKGDERDDFIIWAADCDCKIYGACPRSKAFGYAGEKFGGVARLVLTKTVKPKKAKRR